MDANCFKEHLVDAKLLLKGDQLHLEDLTKRADSAKPKLMEVKAQMKKRFEMAEVFDCDSFSFLYAGVSIDVKFDTSSCV